jgi:hypothetical protein
LSVITTLGWLLLIAIVTHEIVTVPELALGQRDISSAPWYSSINGFSAI